MASKGEVIYGIKDDPDTGKNEIASELSLKKKFRWAFNSTAGNKVVLKKTHNAIPEEIEVIEQLLEDVLPHGYTEA